MAAPLTEAGECLKGRFVPQQRPAGRCCAAIAVRPRLALPAGLTQVGGGLLVRLLDVRLPAFLEARQ